MIIYLNSKTMNKQKALSLRKKGTHFDARS